MSYKHGRQGTAKAVVVQHRLVKEGKCGEGAAWLDSECTTTYSDGDCMGQTVVLHMISPSSWRTGLENCRLEHSVYANNTPSLITALEMMQ